MKTGSYVLIGLTAWATVITAQQGKNPGRAELIDRMHAYYVQQFDNLKMTKDDVFGTARIESSKIKNHLREGGDPGFRSKEWFNSVQIYGNHGKPLVPGKTEFRYSRSQNPLSKGYREAETVPKNPADAKKLPEIQAGLIETAVKRWQSGKLDPWGTQFGHMYFQVRPILLNRKECLGCHSGMKLNQPVAAMVYTVAARVKSDR